MIYIIDDIVTYNSDDCTLSHIPTQESLSLSISACRLFEKLLNSDGEILSRDTLLTEVWDKYGLRGSNSNLNQYLSILRRALAAYGCENVIITIPKIGIRLNTEIKIERESPMALVPYVLPDEVTDESSPASLENVTALPDSVAQNKASAHPFLTCGYAFLAAVMVVVLIGALWHNKASDSAEQSSGMSTIKLEGGCEAIIIKGLDVFEKQSLDEQILQILKDNHQSCVLGRRIYFDKNVSFNATDYGRTILSACNLNSRGHIISCDNFYYLDWKMK